MIELFIFLGFLLILLLVIYLKIKNNEEHKQLSEENSMSMDEVKRLNTELKEIGLQLTKHTKILKHYSGLKKIPPQ